MTPWFHLEGTIGSRLIPQFIVEVESERSCLCLLKLSIYDFSIEFWNYLNDEVFSPFIIQHHWKKLLFHFPIRTFLQKRCVQLEYIICWYIQLWYFSKYHPFFSGLDIYNGNARDLSLCIGSALPFLFCLFILIQNCITFLSSYLIIWQFTGFIYYFQTASVVHV